MGIMFTVKIKDGLKSIDLGADPGSGFTAPNESDEPLPLDSITQLIASTLPRDLLSNYVKLQQTYADELDIRYGTAAVTTRNMAHHVGSHILSNIGSTAGTSVI